MTVNAMRALWVGAPAGNNVWGAVVWSLVILAVSAGRRALPPGRRAVSRPTRRYAAAPRATSLRSGSTHASAAR